MSVIVERCRIEVHAGEARDVADAFAREVRAALPDALGAAFAARPETGIAVVPVMRVSLSAPLGEVRASDVAARIAGAAAEAAATRCSAVAAAGGEGLHESAAVAALAMVGEHDGVTLDAPTEAAAWLVAHARDQRSVVRRASPYADCGHLSIGAAFAEVALRIADARALVRALGPELAQRLAERCSDGEARTILRLLCEGLEVSGDVLAAIAHSVRAHRSEARSMGAAGLAAAVRFAAIPGCADAAIAVLAAGEEEAVAARARADEPLASACTGFWLLLPALARCMRDVDDETGRAIAGALAESLWGASAADDPAIQAFTDGLPPDRASLLPPELRLGRLAVTVVRAFAAELGPFGRARCRYILRAILSGPGSVRRDGDVWYASWPQSPLRIVLERCCVPGAVACPWERPALVTERGDDA